MKMEVTEIGCEVVDLVHLSQERERSGGLLCT
jgi:hypothetical protein